MDRTERSDVEWTPLPTKVYADKPQPTPWDISLDRTAEVLTAYSKPGDQLASSSVDRLRDLGLDPSTMRPDDQLACIDRTYFLHNDPEHCDVQDSWREGSGVWAEVGRHIGFQPAVERLAWDLLII